MTAAAASASPSAVKSTARGRRWLLLRRATQLGLLALFLAGPLAGVWIVKGSLASSLTLGVLPLTDPLMALQSLLAGHIPETAALLGSAIVLAFYLLVGGRAYCAWVCPINMVADLAAWARARLGLKDGIVIHRSLRFWVLGGVLAAAALGGSVVWESVNPVTLVYRGLLYGSLGGAALVAVLAVFLLDFGVAPGAWGGSLCPVGAFYSLIGAKSLLRVSAANRAACNDCMECFAVCPERHVIAPALRGQARGVGPVILSGDCSNCGRCMDVCSKDVFRFATRFRNQPKSGEWRL